MYECTNRRKLKVFPFCKNFAFHDQTMLTTRKKKIIINEHQINDKDTGSSEVQIALLSREILDLTNHLKKNPKDHISRRGLLRMVGKRRRLLAYLERTNPKSREETVKKLKL